MQKGAAAIAVLLVQKKGWVTVATAAAALLAACDLEKTVKF
jgi:hypothetical protein